MIIDIKMTFEKSTKNTHVYEEAAIHQGREAVIPKLYIRKAAFSETPPNVIKVIITTEEDS